VQYLWSRSLRSEPPAAVSMNQFKKTFQDLSSKVPKGMPQGGGGMVSGLAKGVGVLFGIGLVGYGAYESVVTGQSPHLLSPAFLLGSSSSLSLFQ
jgi:hypothetical protein